MKRLVWLTAALIVIACFVFAAAQSGSGSDDTATAAVRSGNLHLLPPAPEPTRSAPTSQGTRQNAFLRAVFDDTERLWRREFRDAGLTYRAARLTIFSHQVSSACGPASGGMGPFYCAASFGVYLDPRFFAALSRRVGVHIGDVAQAYVIAHELGHHVQTLLGITRQMAAADHADPDGSNARSVRFELQADCLAGVWMHSVYRRGELTREDLQQALDAAAVVGDDFLRDAHGQSRPPEDWTHGSSAQRRQWLTTGFVDGRPASCDTFSR